MKKIRFTTKLNQSTIPSQVLSTQARLRRSIPKLETPLLLLGLPQDLVVDLLIDGIQADVCDSYLDYIDWLTHACLNLGLQVDIYWQSLATLDLPGRYKSILLAAPAWPASVEIQAVNQIQRRLEGHLTSQGQLRLIVSQYSTVRNKQEKLLL